MVFAFGLEVLAGSQNRLEGRLGRSLCDFFLLLPARVFCQTPADSMGESLQILVAPLFIEGAGFESTIKMVSELSFAVTAQVILFDHNGAQIASEAVTLPAHSRVAVGIGDLLRRANSAETMGSVKVRPDPAKVVTMAIAA